jgi:predicted DNA-binding protein with PD1-like motif
MSSVLVDSATGPMRVVAHPGAQGEMRMSWTAVPQFMRRQVRLAAGDDLFTALHRLLDEDRADGGIFTIVSGSLAALTLMTGGPGTDTPMTFHGPFEVAAPANVLGGAGVTGIDETGMRTSHSHAAFRDASGREVGGHLIFGKAIAGEQGVLIELTSLSGAQFVRRIDAETGFALFHPEPA